MQFNRHEAAETKDKASVEPNRDFGGHVLLYGVAALFEPFREEQRHRQCGTPNRQILKRQYDEGIRQTCNQQKQGFGDRSTRRCCLPME